MKNLLGGGSHHAIPTRGTLTLVLYAGTEEVGRLQLNAEQLRDLRGLASITTALAAPCDAILRESWDGTKPLGTRTCTEAPR